MVYSINIQSKHAVSTVLCFKVTPKTKIDIVKKVLLLVLKGDDRHNKNLKNLKKKTYNF